MTYIYGLKDPRDGEYHYIGKSDQPKKRLKQHLSKSNNKAKVEWLYDLQRNGLSPELVILEEVEDKNWREVEERWITKGCEKGWPLTNIMFGPIDFSDPTVYEFFRDYLNTDLWSTFAELSKSQKLDIFRQTLTAMGPYSRSELRLAGKRDTYDPDLIFEVGQQAAQRLVRTYC